jgi:ATP-dependent exoDNAse (exonuclease V) beta subunit
MNIGSSADGFIRYIENLYEKALMQSASEGKNAINLMTYHKSKGLEWPVVILTGKESDPLDEKTVLQKNFFGVSVDIPNGVNIEKPLEGRTIILIPWVFGVYNSKVDESVANRVRLLERYTRMVKSATEEEARVLYVGFTRARDILVTTSYNSKSTKWLTAWCGPNHQFDSINGKTPGNEEVDLYGFNQNIILFNFEYEPENNFPILDTTKTKVLKKPETETGSLIPRFHNPSKEPGVENFHAELIKDFEFRINLNGMEQSKEAIAGTCLHRIFALYKTDINPEHYLKIAKETIKRHQLHGNITEPSQVTESIKNLYQFISDTYGAAVKLYKELPLQIYADGLITRGEADLLWETENGLILVDYKSYPGTKSNILSKGNKHYAGNYSGQLNAYYKMIEMAHPGRKKILDALLYYPVVGVVIKLVQS